MTEAALDARSLPLDERPLVLEVRDLVKEFALGGGFLGGVGMVVQAVR